MSISGKLDKEFYLKKYELGELARTAYDFQYFVENYYLVQRHGTTSGFINLYPYQINMINEFTSGDNSLWCLSRQLGFTTLVMAYALWKSMFNPYMTTVISVYDRATCKDRINALEFAMLGIPEFLLSANKINRQQSSITFDNGASIHFNNYNTLAFRGRTVNLLICEEMAFIKSEKLKEVLTCVMPCLAVGQSQAIFGSTPSSSDHEFYKLWSNASNFTKHSLPWTVVPNRDLSFQQNFASMVGPAKFSSEYECQFVN